MHLFTSNFEDYHIKRILISFVFLIVMLGFYSISLKFVDIPEFSAKSQWSKNQIVAERYLYGEDGNKSVIVGSSMAAKMPQRYLGDEVYNLSLIGGSSITGFKIVERSNIIPEKIIYELNVSERDIDYELIENIFEEPYRFIKQNFEMFRHENQPINVFLGLVSKYLGSSEQKKLQEKINPIVLNNELERQRSIMNSFDKQIDIDKTINKLKKLFVNERFDGTELVFVVMPIDEALENTKYVVETKNRYYRAFPKEKFRYLDYSFDHGYETKDGVHLVYSDAVKLAERIRKEISMDMVHWQESVNSK